MAQKRHELEPYDDLGGLDLSQLDLEHIDIEPDEGEGGGIWVLLRLGVLLGLVGLLLWFPTSDYYRQWGDGAFFLLCGVAIVVGLSMGRWLWQWAERAAERHAREASRRAAEPPKPPSRLSRWLTLLVAVGGGAAILFGIPASAYYQNGGESQFIWFVAAAGAVVSGILLARWLLMQADAAPKRQEPPQRIEWPPWTKWAVLGVIVAAGLGALIWRFVAAGQASADEEFGVGGVAFVVGVLAAIWLGRHFEDTEQKLRRERARRSAPPAPRERTF